MVSDDRGQLILIGAIAISLILIGLVLVVNTALFTQVVGTEGSVEMTKEAGVAAEEIEDGASAFAHTENVDTSGDASPSAVRDAVNDDLDPALRNESMNGAGAFVDVSYDFGSETMGTHLYQDNYGTIESSSGNDIVIPDTGTTEIGYARVGINVSDSSTTNDLTVALTGSGGTTATLDITKSSTDQVTLDAPSNTCTVEDTGDFLWIDLTTGFDYTEQCQFDLFDQVDGPYTLELQTDGSDLRGNYDVVVSDSTLLGNPTCSVVQDCNQAIWSYDLKYTYDTEEVTVGTESGETREVNVYD